MECLRMNVNSISVNASLVVLILVVMECLRIILLVATEHISIGFNPCCNGMFENFVSQWAPNSILRF